MIVHVTLLVLLSPSASPSPDLPRDLIGLGGRLLEIANWRDAQTELQSMPAEWSLRGSPARLCVVEPVDPLPGGVMGIDPTNARELIRRGAADAWAALERAGWLAPA